MDALIFTDFHNQYKYMEQLSQKARAVDLIICAGDISSFERGLYEALDVLNTWHRPILMIHGNHEKEVSMMQACSRFKNLDFIHKQERIISNTSILGWGGGGFNTFDKGLDNQIPLWKRVKRKKILVTHAPPHRTRVDHIGKHVGNKTIRKAIEELEPMIAICGHIHENEGKEDVLGQTRIINPGPCGMIINF